MHLRSLQAKVASFTNKRDWKKFHDLKDVVLALSLETAEVVEHFQWKKGKELDKYLMINKKEVGKELADVLYWTLLMCHYLKIDLETMFNEKMAENEKKYPVEKSKGPSFKKYTEL
jgi:dCTP diphosphatase